ncbi:MAG: energy-coupled thiamine transporter ThiT [Clostridia bacterium]|nr:energy-coupled thiamine transporter ThiT [Clostridia bacterium]
MKKSKEKFTKRLTESAIMLALTVILSYLKLLDLPYGGSITLCSMLPTVFIAYRHGMLWGFGVGIANGILQLLMGLSSLSYATSALAAVAIIFLDYIFAFAITGFGGMFKGKFKNQTSELVLGVGLVCVLRYIFHFISGCTVWAGLSIPTYDAAVYSLAYNATYMLPELIIAVAGCAYLSGAVDFSAEKLARVSKESMPKSQFYLKAVGSLGALAAFIADVLLIAPHLQNAETGDFDITGISAVNFGTVGLVTLGGLVWFGVFYFIYYKKQKTN